MGWVDKKPCPPERFHSCQPLVFASWPWKSRPVAQPLSFPLAFPRQCRNAAPGFASPREGPSPLHALPPVWMNKSSEQVCRVQFLVNVMHELVSKKEAKALTKPGHAEELSPSFSSLLIFHTAIPAQDPAALHGYRPKEHALSSAPCLDLSFYLASSHAPSQGSGCFPESWEMVANGLMHVNMLISYWKVNIVLQYPKFPAYTSGC